MTTIDKSDPKQARVLIAEDEAIVAIVMEEMLIECGYVIVGPVDTLSAAERIIEAGQIDVALIDVNLHGTSGIPLARMLLARGIPFAFATGQTYPGGNEFPDAVILHKPFDYETLRQTVAHLVLLMPNSVSSRAL